MSNWWKSAVIYHVYPRSFQDSNGDGVGDLPGIAARLDYLAWLGVDAIWISPIYPSPMADFGYDVTDYRGIDPLFGSMADMDALLTAAHERDIRVILDFVPNHTSDRHPWFVESRRDRTNPKRDWYLWRDPAPGGGPPNNWISRFDGRSAWEWDEATGQYYLHTFLKEQPDLNWRNPAVREAMLDHLRFWFDRGVDGFRVDVAYRVMKSEGLPDNPPNPDWRPGMDPSFRLLETHTKDTADIHQFNRWLRAVVDEYADRVLIGEMNLPIPRLVRHYGNGDEFHLPFNFRLVFAPWERDVVRGLVAAYEAALPAGAWPNWVLSNHDQPRFVTRAGRDQGRIGMMALLTLRGTPTVYYGEEIALENVPIPPEMIQDPWEINVPGLGLGRDPVRTPMQWSSEPHAGFTAPEVAPWLPVAADFTTRNVAVQQADPRSMLNLTRRLLALRRAQPALSVGEIELLEGLPPALLGYVRRAGERRCLVVLNFSGEEVGWRSPLVAELQRPLLGTTLPPEEELAGRRRGDVLVVRPYEGQIWIG